MTRTMVPPAGASDVELLREVASGNAGAIGLLYDRYSGAVLALALRILGDRVEAEDVVHDGFVLLADRAGQYDASRGAVGPWLLTLVRNLAIDRLRRRCRRFRIERRVLVEPPPAESTPEELATKALERTSVIQALSALPDSQRSTLETAFFEGLTYAEIAEREGVPIGTIKSRAARGIAALRASAAIESLVAETVFGVRARSCA